MAVGGIPIAGAQIVIHPFRAVTDAEGRAVLMLPKGRHHLLASKARHDATSLHLDVQGDTMQQVWLAVEPPEDPSEDPDAHYV